MLASIYIMPSSRSVGKDLSGRGPIIFAIFASYSRAYINFYQVFIKNNNKDYKFLTIGGRTVYEGDGEGEEGDESGERDEDGGIGTSKFPSTFTQHGKIYRGARSKSELFPVF